METTKLEITVPTSWNDVTISQFKRVRAVPESGSKILDTAARTSILCNVSVDTLLSIKTDQLKKILESLQWMAESPFSALTTWTDEETGVKYKAVASEDITGFEWVALEDMLTDPDNRVQDIVAVICREYVDGKILAYDSETLVERSQIFEEKMSIAVATGIALSIQDAIGG